MYKSHAGANSTLLIGRELMSRYYCRMLEVLQYLYALRLLEPDFYDKITYVRRGTRVPG